jgi:hypothetical protein
MSIPDWTLAPQLDYILSYLHLILGVDENESSSILCMDEKSYYASTC